MRNILDCIEGFSNDKAHTQFLGRGNITVIESKAKDNGICINVDTIIQVMTELSTLYPQYNNEINNIVSDCKNQHTFKPGILDFEEFKSELTKFVEKPGIIRMLYDKISNTSGSYTVDIDFALRRLFRYYKKYGSSSMDKLLDYYKEADGDKIAKYENPYMHDINSIAYTQLDKQIDIPSLPDSN